MRKLGSHRTLVIAVIIAIAGPLAYILPTPLALATIAVGSGLGLAAYLIGQRDAIIKRRREDARSREIIMRGSELRTAATMDYYANWYRHQQ
jgi:hypothetical protein